MKGPERVAIKRKRGLTRVEKTNLRNGLLFVAPWLVGFGLFLAYPISMSLYYSLCDFSVLQPARFIGLENYRQLLGDEAFLQALANTVVYALAAIPLSILVALSLAMLLNTGVPGMAVYRTIFFLPSLVPAVAMGILWLLILNGKNGILNLVLGTVLAQWGWMSLLLLTLVLLVRSGTPDPPHLKGRKPGRPRGRYLGAGLAGALVLFLTWQSGNTAALGSCSINLPSWLSETAWVKPAFVLVTLYGVGNSVVIYLAGLQDVPVHLLEAADLDGATWWQKVQHVTLPMVSPTILFNGIMAIIGTFNFFALPFVMAPGGQPARSAYFLAVNLFDNAFLYLRMGYASAMAWILFVIVFGLTMLALRLSDRHVHYGGS